MRQNQTATPRCGRFPASTPPNLLRRGKDRAPAAGRTPPIRPCPTAESRAPSSSWGPQRLHVEAPRMGDHLAYRYSRLRLRTPMRPYSVEEAGYTTSHGDPWFDYYRRDEPVRPEGSATQGYWTRGSARAYAHPGRRGPGCAPLPLRRVDWPGTGVWFDLALEPSAQGGCGHRTPSEGQETSSRRARAPRGRIDDVPRRLRAGQHRRGPRT